MDGTPWKGAEDLRPHLVSISDVVPDPQNARRHPERNLEAIRASLREFGQRKPIVVRGACVIAGSGTLVAASAEGWTEIAVVNADDLDDEQASAYALADNQTGDLATWNAEALRDALGVLPVPLKRATGFSTDEIEAVASMAFGKSGTPEAPKKPEREEGFVTVVFAPEQATIIEGAVQKLREVQGDLKMTPARALELLAADFLAGQ